MFCIHGPIHKPSWSVLSEPFPTSVKKVDATLSSNVTLKVPSEKGIDEDYMLFWKNYAENFITKLNESEFDMTSHDLINWTITEKIPNKAFSSNMSSKEQLSMRTTYGRCVLYSTCTGPSNLFSGNVSVLGENIACLSSKHRKQHKTCEKEGLKLFEVTQKYICK